LELAEVMQEVSLVAWRKFADENADSIESGFGAWLTVIARYEILKFRRGCARDRLVFDSAQIERLCEEGATLEEVRRRESSLDALQRCLAKLPKDRRHLLLQAYTQGTSVKAMAEALGKQPDALYQLLRRLRVDLANCVERELEAGRGMA